LPVTPRGATKQIAKRFGDGANSILGTPKVETQLKHGKEKPFKRSSLSSEIPWEIRPIPSNSQRDGVQEGFPMGTFVKNPMESP